MAEYQKHWRLGEYVQLLIYVAEFLKITRPHLANPLIYAARKTRRHKLQLMICRISLKVFNSLTSPLIGFEADLNADVIFSKRNAIIYGLRNGGWYSVVFFGQQDLESSRLKRWIRVNTSSNVGNDECLLSPILYHNIQQHMNYDEHILLEFDDNVDNLLISDPVKRVLTLWKESCGVQEGHQSETAIQRSPKKAAEVHVELIESPKYRCGNELEVLLSDTFQVPKAAAIGDLLSLSIPSHLGYEFSTNTSIIPPKHIFIRISSIQKEQNHKTKDTLLVDNEVTSLYLVGSTHCLLPPLCEDFDNIGALDVAPVLRKTLKKVSSVLQSELRERKLEISSGERSTNTVVKGKKSPSRHKESPGNSSTSSPAIERKVASKSHREKTVDRDHIANSANILVLGPNGSGSEQILELSASALGLSVVWADCWHLKGDTSGSTEARLRQIFLKAAGQAPCVLALANVHSIAKDRDGGEDARVVAALKEEVTKLPAVQPPVFLMATAPCRTKISGDLWSIWSHQEYIEIPDLSDRRQMLEWLLSKWLQSHQIQTLAQRTAGYLFGDLQALLNAAQRHRISRLQASEKEDTGLIISSSLTYEDVVKALDELQFSRSEAIGAPRIPQVKWNEVGGLEEAKREVINTIQLPLRHPSLVSSRLRRSGVLLYGPPGTGKTLLAKAVATECGLNFLSVKGPELLNMYVGQSEENVRQVFSKARAAAPCIIFFDELDSLAPNRGRSGDSGGVMDRIVSALLAELDGVSSSSDVFVLAATNRPDLIDPALLRPGRFEKLVFLGVCEERAGQIKILQAVTSKIPLKSDVSLERVAEMLPLTLTGADIYALCTDALYTALHRTTQQIAEGLTGKEDADVLVEEEDFAVAANNLVPSVTASELAHYRTLSTKKQR